MVVEAKKRPKKIKGEKKEKIDTKQLTFDLYKEGKTVKEIAALRNFAVTTIEGHLAHFVKLKQVKATDFVTDEEIKKILDVAARMNNPLLGQLKVELGDNYSYTEIRMALASTGEKVIAKA